MELIAQNWQWLLVILLVVVLQIILLVNNRYIVNRLFQIERDIQKLSILVAANSDELKALTSQVNKLTIDKSRSQQINSIETMISKPYNNGSIESDFVEVPGIITLTLEYIINCYEGD